MEKRTLDFGAYDILGNSGLPFLGLVDLGGPPILGLMDLSSISSIYWVWFGASVAVE